MVASEEIVMTSQLSKYGRLSCFTFLLALALLSTQRGILLYPCVKASGALLRRGIANNNDTMLFVEQEARIEHFHMKKMSQGGNPQSNATHALMVDTRTGTHWMVEKHSIEHYDADFLDLMNRKYKPHNASFQLDIISALGPAAVLEMEDGREYKCLGSFHKVWSSEPFSGEPFLDWLDFGSGRELDSELCNHMHLNRRRYQMLNQIELEASRVEFHTETLVHINHDYNDDNQNATTMSNAREMVYAAFAATQLPVEPGLWLAVLDLNHNLYLIKEGFFPARDQPFDYWKRGHGSVTGGRPVLFAGEMVTVGRRGRVGYVIPNSGHYRPQLKHSKAFYRWIRDLVGDAAQTAIDWRPKDSASKSELKEWGTLFDDDDEI